MASYNLIAVTKITVIILRTVFVQRWYSNPLQKEFLESSLQIWIPWPHPTAFQSESQAMWPRNLQFYLSFIPPDDS